MAVKKQLKELSISLSQLPFLSLFLDQRQSLTPVQVCLGLQYVECAIFILLSKV